MTESAERCAICRKAPASRAVVYFPPDQWLGHLLCAIHEDTSDPWDQFPTWPVAYTCGDCLLAVNSLTAPPQPSFDEALALTSESWGERLRTCVARQVWS